MNDSLRKERIGVTHAARVLNVSVSELKDAIHRDGLLRGYPPPQPMARGLGVSGTGMTFYLGEVMDLADKLSE